MLRVEEQAGYDQTQCPGKMEIEWWRIQSHKEKEGLKRQVNTTDGQFTQTRHLESKGERRFKATLIKGSLLLFIFLSHHHSFLYHHHHLHPSLHFPGCKCPFGRPRHSFIEVVFSPNSTTCICRCWLTHSHFRCLPKGQDQINISDGESKEAAITPLFPHSLLA